MIIIKDQTTHPANILIISMKMNPIIIAMKAEAVIIIQVFLRFEMVSSRPSIFIAYLIFS